MKVKRLIFFLTVLIITVVAADISWGKEVVEGIPLSQVPKNVIRSAEAEISGLRVLDAKKITSNTGDVLYLLDGALGQKSYEVMVDSNGNIMDGGSSKEIKQDMPLSQVPGNILLAARNEMRGLKVLKAAVLEGKDGIENYEIEGVLGKDTYRIKIGIGAEIIGSEIVDKYAK